MSEFQNQTRAQFKEQEKERQFAKEHEGEVKIKTSSKHDKPESDGLGEFVDYEEVE